MSDKKPTADSKSLDQLITAPATKEFATGAIPGFISGFFIKSAIRPFAYLAIAGFFGYKFGQKSGYFGRNEYIESTIASAHAKLDLNGDGKVDLDDAKLAAFQAQNWGSSLINTMGVTGPSGLGFGGGFATAFLFF